MVWVVVMVHLLHQLVWAKRCPESWLNTVSGMSWGCFQRRLTFELVNWVKKMVLPSVGEHWPFFWGPKENKKVEEDWMHFLSDWWTWNIGMPGSQASNAVRNLHHRPPSSQAFELHQLSWVSSWNLQMASHVISQLPKSLEPIPYNKPLYIYVCMFININRYIFSLCIYNIIIHIYFLYTHTHTYEESWLASKCSIFSPISC